MSSKTNKMIKPFSNPEQEDQAPTKSMTYRIDVQLDTNTVSTYMVVTGIPEDLPEEYEHTVMRAAEGQFANALNSRVFLEFYSVGKTVQDEQPTFYNLTKIDKIQIMQIIKVAN